MQYNSDGLFIGEFGTPELQRFASPTWANGYGVAGNSFSPFVVQVNGTTYLYLNDEGNRSLMRWHLADTSSIQEQSQSVVIDYPNAPTSLVATPVSTTQINLSWTNNATNQTGFQIDQATSSDFTMGLTTVTVAANVTTYSATGLANGTTYYYRVRATNSYGDSANTSTASARRKTSPRWLPAV